MNTMSWGVFEKNSDVYPGEERPRANMWNLKECHVKEGFDVVSDAPEVKIRTCLFFLLMIPSTAHWSQHSTVGVPKGKDTYPLVQKGEAEGNFPGRGEILPHAQICEKGGWGASLDRMACVRAQRCESKRANRMVGLECIRVKLGSSQK